MARRTRATLAAVVTALCVLVMPGVALGQDAEEGHGLAPAGVGPHGWTVETVTVTSTTGPGDDLEIPLDVDLWIPDAASAATPVPAVVVAHGFGNTKTSAEITAISAYLAGHGYLAAAVTSQGFGGSGGCISLDSIDYDAKNVSAVIDLLAARDDVTTESPGDPRVGIVGGSYGGGHQALVAAIDPRVDALAPGRTWNHLAFSLVTNNWVDPAGDGLYDLDAPRTGVFKRQWTTLLFASGVSQPVNGNGGCDPGAQQAADPATAPCPGFIPDICPTFARLQSTGTPDDADFALVDRSSGALFLDRVDVPVLWSQGLPDALFTPTEATASHVALRARGVESKLFWHSSGHGGYQPAPGDGEPYGGTFDASPASQQEFAATYWARRHLAWFDRHVRGDTSVDTGPVFAWFRDHVAYDVAATGGSSAPAYGTRDTVPDPAEGLALWLAGERLVPTAPSAAAEVSFVAPPNGQPGSYTRTSNFQTTPPFSSIPPSDPPGQAVTFTSDPLAAPVEVVGVPVVTLPLAHANGQDAVVFAKLFDVSPDGTETLVWRQVAPSRVPDDRLATPVDLRLVGTAHRFPAGHAVRLVLASTDQAYFGLPAPDQLTVTTGPDAVLRLPVVPAAATPADPVPTGSDPASSPLPATGGGLGAAALLVAAATVLSRRGRGARGQ